MTDPTTPKYQPADPLLIPKRHWTLLLQDMKRGKRTHADRVEANLQWQDHARREFSRSFPEKENQP